MARLLGFLLAVTAGAATALLLASGVSTQDAEGRTVSCSSVIGAAAVGPSPSVCTDALTRRTELSALAGLLCIVGGSVATFAGRPAQTTNHPTPRTARAGANPTR